MNQIEPSDFTTASFGELSRFPSQRSATVVIEPSCSVRLTRRPVQRLLGMLACLCCLAYAGLFMVASYKWVSAVMTAHIGAEDLDQFGITVGAIVVIVPIGFALVLIRYLEIFYRIFTHRQVGLGLADEAGEASKLAGSHEERH